MSLRSTSQWVVALSLALAGSLVALTPEEAVQHFGKEGAVDGIAVQVSQANGNVYVNMGAKFPDHTFTALIAQPDVANIGLEYLNSLEGKSVSVVGRIVKVRDKPQIQVTKKDQIIQVAAPAK